MFRLKLPSLSKEAQRAPDATTYPSKINVGCGFDKRPGYLNVDMSASCEPDLVLKNNDYSRLPAGHFEEVLANDVLEHIPRAQTLGVLLEWANLLKMAGEVVLSTSNVLGAAKQMSGKSYADRLDDLPVRQPSHRRRLPPHRLHTQDAHGAAAERGASTQ